MQHKQITWARQLRDILTGHNRDDRPLFSERLTGKNVYIDKTKEDDGLYMWTMVYAPEGGGGGGASTPNGRRCSL